MTSLCRLSNTISPMAIFFPYSSSFSLFIFFFIVFTPPHSYFLLNPTYIHPTSVLHRSLMEPTSTQHRPYIDPKTKEEEEGKGGGGLSDMHDLHEIQ